MKGRGQIKTCESSKRFNRKTNKCDWMANVQCQETASPSQRFFAPTTEDYDVFDVEGVGPRVECERGASGLFEHPYDCSKFVNCANGVTYIQDCGRGTVYNPLIKSCDWPHKVDCEDRTPRQRGETVGQYRERKSRDFGEEVIQPRNNIEIVFEDAEAQVLRTNVSFASSRASKISSFISFSRLSAQSAHP
jgi:Chitin binding Peritrophin-A domain